MKFLVVPDDEGQYVNNDGEHFNVIYGGFVRGPRASEFKEFDTLQHALEYYGLTDPNAPIIEPEVNNDVSEEDTEAPEDLEELAETTDAESVVVTQGEE